MLHKQKKQKKKKKYNVSGKRSEVIKNYGIIQNRIHGSLIDYYSRILHNWTAL